MTDKQKKKMQKNERIKLFKRIIFKNDIVQYKHHYYYILKLLMNEAEINRNISSKIDRKMKENMCFIDRNCIFQAGEDEEFERNSGCCGSRLHALPPHQ